MTSKNDITGDEIKSRGNSKEYKENFDKIFNKDKPSEPIPDEETPKLEWDNTE